MNPIRFFTDEDVYGAVASGLRRAGFDAVSTPEAGRLGESDESQLQWATNQARVVITFNVADFADLHVRWLQSGQHHAGMIVSAQRGIGDILRRLTNLTTSLDADSMRDRLEFLSDW